jgi:hypothetical protein
MWDQVPRRSKHLLSTGRPRRELLFKPQKSTVKISVQTWQTEQSIVKVNTHSNRCTIPVNRIIHSKIRITRIPGNTRGGIRCRGGLSIPCRPVTPAVSPVSWSWMRNYSLSKIGVPIQSNYCYETCQRDCRNPCNVNLFVSSLLDSITDRIQNSWAIHTPYAEWRCHHCLWRAAKFRPILSAEDLWAGRDL